MRKVKVLSLLLALVLALVFSLSACGDSTQQPSEENGEGNSAGENNSGTGSQSEPIKLTYWTSNELHTAMYEFGAEAYNKKYPDQPIELSGEVYPNAEMHNKLLIALQSNTGAPDIADININYFSNFVKGGNIQLVDLTDIVTPVLDKMVKSRFDIYAKDGKYYGLPTHLGATVVYYNKEITDKAGVDIDSINTWDDYVKAGKQVVEKAGVPMTAFEVSNQRPFWPLIVQRGGDYLAPDGSVVLDSEINIDTLQFMYDMVFKDKVAIPMPGSDTTKEEFWTFMNKGGMASLIMPSWYMSRFLNYMPDLKGKIYVRPLPVFEASDARTVGMGGTATSITVQCKNIDVAKKLITEVKLTPEAGINIWQKLRFDPVRKDIWDSEELLKPDEYFGNESFFKVMAPYLDNMPSPVNGELSSAAQDLVFTVMYKVFVERSATPEEALKEAANELRAMQ
jgi:arabinosaccharide transport system substrate-binding protein